MMKVKKEDTVFCGCFRDADLETEYFDTEISESLRYIRPALLILGILYLLFIIPDYFVITSRNTIVFILVNRLTVMLMLFVLYIRSGFIRNYTAFSYWITAYELIVSVSFFLIFYRYESADFLIQAFGVITIVLCIFLVPNKWINMVAASAFVGIGFLVLSLAIYKDTALPHLSAGFAYIFLVIVLSSISSYRISFYKRIQYLNREALIKLSTTDALTGLYNRHKFDKELHFWVDHARYNKLELSLILLDFDDFKRVNDSFGHLIGDKVIVETVNIICTSIRETDIFSRWGGEEFILLLPETSGNKALELARRLRKTISEHAFENGIGITCSFGLVQMESGDDPVSLLQKADQLLYQAKKAGKDTVCTAETCCQDSVSVI